ncbi:proteinaceous RNase P 1, chloroplastic/mitochondrial [Humulus lupulus]|uniref:proteinaceous RNase P 1, chloroplastic/mitochondrial n=1 Tax=Humulus lupulus TaxID=3486 RepID=UPI002B41015F|nr:proteinaceous RNase P 1, chloroplastic/mitochondrial [Humulus lupulus]
MMSNGSFLLPSLARSSPLLSFFVKIPLPLIYRQSRSHFRSFDCYSTCLSFERLLVDNISLDRFSLGKSSRFCTLASSRETSAPVPNSMSSRATKKARRESPEGLLKHKFDMCSKHGDVAEALRLYDEARSNGVQLNLNHYNVLLYLCSSSGSGSSGELSGEMVSPDLVLKRGFEIFQQMVIDKVAPNEATITSAARLAAAAEDPERAFELVKQMKIFGIPPKLRSYGPALFGFCKKGEAERAYEVDAHMTESGVVPEETELSALLKLSSDTKKGDKVYEMLHRLRTTIRQVSESTAEFIEAWFESEEAAKVGKVDWDVNKVKEGVRSGGGGWHGQGWLGTGSWRALRTQIKEEGVCQSCNEKLVCIDIDPRETENFATSLTSLACGREVKEDFLRFQEWLQRHGPFDAVIDAANVGLIKQHTFSFFQLKSVVHQLRQISPSKKLPLIILHTSRVNGGPAQDPRNKKLIEMWKKVGALYATPAGSNDDWYWLYAAVSCNCLLVTNDEMRDHLFQLLGTSFFPRWKEKHQVRLSVSSKGPQLHMPPPYSIVIQESEDGRWHVPTVTGDDLETPRQWLCATRARNTD